MEYKSHPDKNLDVHIMGTFRKALKRYNSPIVKWATLFHDIAKVNENFQWKLSPDYNGKSKGYDEHAYLSAWAWLCFLEKNGKIPTGVQQELGGDVVKMQIILTLIAKHHGNLPNFGKLLNEIPLERLKNFIKSRPKLPLSDFLTRKLHLSHEKFQIEDSPFANRLVIFNHKDKWQQQALDYFLETQFSFASLIEADKRDAGEKYIENYYHLETTCKESSMQLSENLNKKWTWLSNKKEKSELDTLRTAIREEAMLNIKAGLLGEQRIYTLTAPTGSGKTFTLLALASVILEKIPGMSILYAVPFLSITDQVEKIIKVDLSCELLSANSKSINERIEELISKLNTDPQAAEFTELLRQDFIAQTFDHPLIITTFVQLFETLLSNRNSTLIKLPNFSNRIFLIDEIQALPPRLYIFFTAWLDAFCRKHNSYAILSTATMPKMDFGIKDHIRENQKPEKLFKDYLNSKPYELLMYEKYFSADPFNRYRIHLANSFELSMDELLEVIIEQKRSCLVILNTIRDSRILFEKLSDGINNVYLLNTYFIPVDRKEKINLINTYLAAKEKVILISTQLIEAGVDIDFPIVFRDLCPLPNLIQSAGRCNRNNKLFELGQVWFFHLKKENGKSGATAVYRNEAKLFLDFSMKHIQNGMEERDLLKVQKQFFEIFGRDLMIGDYEIEKEKVNLIELVNDAAFETVGKFKLINEKDFGFEFQYFIPESNLDDTYEIALKLLGKVVSAKDFESKKKYQIQLNNQLKKVNERVVTIRTFDKDNIPLARNDISYFNIKVLSDLSLYTFENGFIHSSVENSCL
jgi:CRISPR-associated endonuclease/helicase Cas3